MCVAFCEVECAVPSPKSHSYEGVAHPAGSGVPTPAKLTFSFGEANAGTVAAQESEHPATDERENFAA